MNRFFKLTIAIVCALPLLWLMGKALPLLAPFLISLGAAAVMEPAVRGMCRRGVKRPLAAGLLTCLLLAGCIGLVSCCAAGGARLLTTYAKKAPALLTALTNTAETVKQSMTRVMEAIPNHAAEQLSGMMDGFTAQLSELPMWASKQALDGVTAFAKSSPDWLLFVCTAVIGIYFFSLYFPDMVAFFRRQLPDTALTKLTLIRRVLREAAGGYLKVQCILSGITFLILLLAFALMGIGDSIPAAAAIAVIDALPILGAGAVLIPWALMALLLGNVPRAAGIAAIYAVLLVTHNVLQAKLMGSQLGLHPVTALVSLYAGWKLAGFGGMLLLPIGCVVVCSLNDAGIIKLYR